MGKYQYAAGTAAVQEFTAARCSGKCERYSTDDEEGIVQSDQVTVKNSWDRLVFVLDWMSQDLDHPRHISASDRKGGDGWIKTQYRNTTSEICPFLLFSAQFSFFSLKIASFFAQSESTSLNLT